MKVNRRRAASLVFLILALAVIGIMAGGCAKKGTSGLTFYEFFDPT